VSDGTANGTFAIDAAVSTCTQPGQLTQSGKTLFFTATDDLHGEELWGLPVSNTPPMLQGIEATSLIYRGNSPAKVVTASLTVSDADRTELTGATIQITGNYHQRQDLLSFAGSGGIFGRWNPAEGILTLTGRATVTAYQAALRAVKYRNLSSKPSPAMRTVTFAGSAR